MILLDWPVVSAECVESVVGVTVDDLDHFVSGLQVPVGLGRVGAQLPFVVGDKPLAGRAKRYLLDYCVRTDHVNHWWVELAAEHGQAWFGVECECVAANVLVQKLVAFILVLHWNFHFIKKFFFFFAWIK